MQYTDSNNYRYYNGFEQPTRDESENNSNDNDNSNN